MKLDPAIADRFSPQLATDMVNMKPKHLPVRWPKLGSTKLDGIRALTLDSRVVTRSFKSLPNEYISEALKEWQGLDGELIVGSPTAEDVYRVTDSAVMSIKGQPVVTYYAFDDLTRLDLPFEDRLKVLQDRNLPDWIRVLTQVRFDNLEAAEASYSAALSEGFEGMMLRNPGSMYKFGRCTAVTQDSLKWKPFQDDEAVVLEVLEAQTNNNEAFTDELGRTARSSHAANKEGNGMAGMFLVRDEKTGVIFKISAGKLKHDERRHIWENRADYVNRVAKYRHFIVGVKDKPRHGRWIGWRSELDMN